MRHDPHPKVDEAFDYSSSPTVGSSGAEGDEAPAASDACDDSSEGEWIGLGQRRPLSSYLGGQGCGSTDCDGVQMRLKQLETRVWLLTERYHELVSENSSLKETVNVLSRRVSSNSSQGTPVALTNCPAEVIDRGQFRMRSFSGEASSLSGTDTDSASDAYSERQAAAMELAMTSALHSRPVIDAFPAMQSNSLIRLSSLDSYRGDPLPFHVSSIHRSCPSLGLPICYKHTISFS